MHSLKMSDLVVRVRSQYSSNALANSGSTQSAICLDLTRFVDLLRLERFEFSDTLRWLYGKATIIARIRFAYKTAKHLLAEVSLISFCSGLNSALIFSSFSKPLKGSFSMTIQKKVSPPQEGVGFLQGFFTDRLVGGAA